jgi:hypothetical protein
MSSDVVMCSMLTGALVATRTTSSQTATASSSTRTTSRPSSTGRGLDSLAQRELSPTLKVYVESHQSSNALEQGRYQPGSRDKATLGMGEIMDDISDLSAYMHQCMYHCVCVLVWQCRQNKEQDAAQGCSDSV